MLAFDIDTVRRQALLASLVAGLALAGGCGGDDGGDAPDNGGQSGGAGGAGASGGSGGGGGGGAGGAGGSGGAGGGGSGGSGGASGAGASGGSGGGGAMDAGTDSGADAGMPDPFACVAPDPAVDFGGDCNAADPAELELTPLRTDLGGLFPIFVTHAPGDTSRLFVAGRSGEVLVLDPEDGSTIATFFDLDDRVIAASNSGGEYGLLGFAFHPNYPEDPRVFVNYTADAAPATTEWNPTFDTIVSSFIASDGTNTVDMDSEQVLVRFGQPQSNHNGGMIAFGRDNCLYIGSGDGGNSNDQGTGHSPGGNGQDLSNPLGKILRIDPDNPNERAPGNPEGPGYMHIWDHGIRNPWRFSFDRDTGDLYIGDVGQGDFEEISVAPRGAGDNNFGWPIMEGLSCFGGGCDMNGLVLPASDYDNVAGDNCVIGGYVYRGAAIPSLQGWYVYGDSGDMRRIRAFVWDGQSACETPILLSQRDGLTVNARITSFGEDAAGELYLTTSSGVYRFDPAE